MKIPNLFGAIKFPEDWNPFGFVQQQLQQIRQKTTDMHKRVATTPPATTTNSAATISTITGSAGNMPAASCTMPPAANLTAKITASNSGGSKSSSNPSTNTNISNNNNNNNNNNTKNLTGITGSSSSGSSSGNNNRISGPAPAAPAPAPTVSPVKFSPDTVDLRLAPEGGSLRQRIYDCCAYVIFCAAHRTIAVSVHSGTGAIWLPFTVLPSNRSWNEGALYGSFIVLSGGLSERFIALRESIPYQDAHLLEVARLQLPQSGEYVTRLVFLIRLDRASSSSSNNNNNNNSNNQFRCCQPNQSSTTRLCWLPLEQITSGLVEMAWGPELVQWCKWIAAPTPQRIRSISCADAISSSSSAGKIGLRNQLDSIAFDTMLRQANVTHRDIELAYSDFIDHCFPAHTMTLCSFRCFMSVRYDFEKDERRLRRLFKAFNFIGRNGYLSFRELLLGLAACEPSAAHVEPRIRFVFRYYDNRGKAVLFEDDFRRLMRDLCPADTDRALDQRISECAKLFRLQEIGSQFGITYDEFYRAVTVTGEGGFRGTSALCRAKRDIFSLISRTVANRQAKQSVSKTIRTKKSASSASSNNNNNNNNDNIEESDETAAAAPNIIGSIIGKKWHQGSCGRCKERDWSLFPAVLRQNSSGQISLFRRLQSSQTMCTSGENRNTTNNNNNNNININAKQQQKSRSPPSPPAPPAQVPLKSMIGIKKTIKTSSPTLANTSTNVSGTGESFLSPENVANRLLAAIRVFSRNKGTIEKPNGLMSGNANDTNRLMAMFGTIHDDMLRLHDNGYGKCVPISSPCFIIGDIHGNLEDLLTLEQTIWRTIPLAANLLFLGDYVDRGKWSVECALYVCALKSLYPHKVTLLRGNHEIRDIQRKYSFATECTAKYGKVAGERMWDMFNRIFDRLPIVSVIDDAIFAAHGGIPHDNAELAKQIARLPLDIVAPDRCDLVWEIVWSDPLQDALFLKVCDLLDVEPKAAGGFVRNTKRGAAWFFDSDGAKAFFAANRLTHIVRAHEVPPNGFWFHFGDKCVTVFSCSHYCGNQNECAVLFARQGAIRPIRIDTANNMPATDDH